MRVLACICVCFFSLCISAQELSTKSKKAINYYAQTEYMVIRRQYVQAVELLHAALDKDENFVEAHLRIGTCYEALNKTEEALFHYKTAVSLEPDNPRYSNAYRLLGNQYFRGGDYENAMKFLEQFLSYKPANGKYTIEVERTLVNARFAIEKIKSPLPFNPRPIPAPVNTLRLQYFPVLTADQKSILFTGRKGYGALDDEDIYISSKDENGKWSVPESLSSTINSRENEGTCAVSADGRTMIFTACKGRSGYGSCDLYISKKTGDTWAKPQNLGSNVNSKSWDSQPSLSADGRTLFFVSNRVGGYGQRDIWVTHLEADSLWSIPTNLGPTINTQEDEVSPLIHVNGQTMYFASKGLPGFGGLDIFRTEFNGVHWSEPENLGYPLNTSDDQLSLFISTDGKKGYYSNEKKLRTEYFSYLFEFDVPDEIKIKKKSNYVYGTIKDAQTGEFLQANIKLIDINKDTLISSVVSDEMNGKYTTVLNEGVNYALYVEQKGYLFQSLAFSDSADFNKQPININISLEPIKSGTKTVLNNIFFDFDKHELLPKSMSELTKVLNFLTSNSSVKIEIAGHTDNAGNPEYNQQLSKRRAKAVFDFLVNGGIEKRRMRYMGYGETQPKVVNNNDANRKLNRRIEFVLN